MSMIDTVKPEVTNATMNEIEAAMRKACEEAIAGHTCPDPMQQLGGNVPSDCFRCPLDYNYLRRRMKVKFA
jgi:hypothetical protein